MEDLNKEIERLKVENEKLQDHLDMTVVILYLLKATHNIDSIKIDKHMLNNISVDDVNVNISAIDDVTRNKRIYRW